MGYRRKARTYTLQFTDPDLEGLEIVARGVSAGEYLELTELTTGLAATSATQAENAAATAAADGVFRLLASKLVSWNLEDDHGNAVPATYQGLKGQDLLFVQQIVVAWMQAIGGVTPPLPEGSPSGATSRADLAQMEELSRSLQSLSAAG